MSRSYGNNSRNQEPDFKKCRCVMLGEYIRETKTTVRGAAKKFGISKSTVHKDVTERLRLEDMSLYEEVQKILMKNKRERHIRGGIATKEKYIKIKEGNKMKKNRG